MFRKPSSIIGIDLGNSSLKIVQLQKKGEQYFLAKVGKIFHQQSPNQPESQTEQGFAAQLKELTSLVKTSGADVHYSINPPNSAIRYVELPKLPLQEVRAALKLNSAIYLRQNFDHYTFDVCPLDHEAVAAFSSGKQKNKKASPTATLHGKIKVLVGGISSSEVVLYFHASRRAGIKPRSLQLAPISLINGFEAAYPEIFQNQAIAILDFGHLSSSLTILDKGTPLLTRVVPIGGKHITEFMAQAANLAFAQAEAAKLQADSNLNNAVNQTIVSLVREVQSSINFFEKNSDQAISKVYLAGASVYSTTIVESLSRDIGTICEPLNATQGLTIDLPVEQQDIFAQNPFAFSTALGTARTYTMNTMPKAQPIATA